jgi:hypothetical protein
MEDQPTQLSRKERARQQRRAAYLRAKEHRATDPKQLVFKEAMKQRRLELNEVVKARRKAAMHDQKVRRSEREAERRTAQGQQLTLVRPATERE